MAVQTSLTYASAYAGGTVVELNDGIDYLTPYANSVGGPSALDDHNAVNPTYAHAQNTPPKHLGMTVQESTVFLQISIVVSGANWETQLDTKLNKLKALFNPRDPKFYPLKRKRSFDTNYRTMNAAARTFTFDKIKREAYITLHVPNHTWAELTPTTSSYPLFAGPTVQTNVVVNNPGNHVVEPVITLTAQTPTSNSTLPEYFVDISVFLFSPVQALKPLLIVQAWNTSSLVSSAHMRADGLDITAQLIYPATGINYEHYIAGTAASRNVWINPAPSRAKPVPSFPVMEFVPSLQYSVGNLASNYAITSTDTRCIAVCSDTQSNNLPQTGYFFVDQECIQYSSYTVVSSTNPNDPNYSYYTKLLINIQTRGVNSTTAANHYTGSAFMRWHVFRLNYGYPAGLEPGNLANNDLGTCLLDYSASSNAEWIQSNTHSSFATANTGIANNAYQAGSWYGGYEPPLQSSAPGEYTYTAPLNEAINPISQAIALKGFYNHNTVAAATARQRLVWERFIFKEPIYQIRFKGTVQGVGANPGFTASLYAVINNFGQPGQEHKVLITSVTCTSTTLANFDTGVIAIPNLIYSQNFTHLVWSISNIPPTLSNTATTFLTITEAHYFWGGSILTYPIIGVMSTEGGVGVSQYGEVIAMANFTDPNAKTFNIYTRAQTNDVMTLDCANKTVSRSGSILPFTLREVSYTNPTWLRLLPGNNTINFTTITGNGTLSVGFSFTPEY